MATKPKVQLLKTPATKKAAAAAPEAEAEAAQAEPEQKTIVKKVTKAKAAPAPAVAEAEVAAVDSKDLIVQTAHEIENLNEGKALALIPQLLDNMDRDGFKLGGYLSKVQAEGWFMNAGYETFKAWVEAVCGIQYRKAMYLIGIYNALVQSGVAYDKVKGIGWTKLKELAPILSPDNVDDWVALAAECTVLQLIEQIKAATKGEDSGANTDEEKAPKDVTTITFKVHPDQKATIEEALAKAKHQTGSEVNTVALEAICLDYLSKAGTNKKPASIKELMGKKDPGEVLGVFNEVFPNIFIRAQVYETAEEAQAAEAAAEAEAE